MLPLNGPLSALLTKNSLPGMTLLAETATWHVTLSEAYSVSALLPVYSQPGTLHFCHGVRPVSYIIFSFLFLPTAISIHAFPLDCKLKRQSSYWPIIVHQKVNNENTPKLFNKNMGHNWDTERPWPLKVDRKHSVQENKTESVKRLCNLVCVCALAHTRGCGCSEDLISSLGSKFLKEYLPGP